MSDETSDELVAQQLRGLFQQGVDAVGGKQATARYLSQWEIPERVHLLAIGKAADAMSQGALPLLGNRLVRGLVISKHGHVSEVLKQHAGLQWHESGHPVPDAASLQAGQYLVDFVAGIPVQDQLLMLVSGGASALVEHLQPGETLARLAERTHELLASGAAIGEMNQVRRQASLIKGGRLARQLTGCKVLQLLISDVPGDHLADIGSGLMIPDADNGMPSDEPLWRNVSSHIVASNAIAQQAAAQAAASMSVPVVQSSGSLDGPVEQVVERLCHTLRAGQAGQAGKGYYIWGGEPTVVLPDSPGRGGRNQHLALALAERIGGGPNCSVLVCGTDGSDGPTTDAGAIVSHMTAARCKDQNLDLRDFLTRADAGNCLDKLNALVTTGPTGTNVMDLAIARLY